MARLAFSICQAKQNSKGIRTFKANIIYFRIDTIFSKIEFIGRKLRFYIVIQWF